MALAESFEVAEPGQEPGQREARAAIAIAAGLYLVGAILCATAALLPHVDSPAGVTAVALDALLTAALLFYAAERGWGGLGLAFVADLWGVGDHRGPVCLQRRRAEPVRADLLLRDRPRRGVPAARALHDPDGSRRWWRSSRHSPTKRPCRACSARSRASASCSRC